jgi:hypothetical protein
VRQKVSNVMPIRSGARCTVAVAALPGAYECEYARPREPASVHRALLIVRSVLTSILRRFLLSVCNCRIQTQLSCNCCRSGVTSAVRAREISILLRERLNRKFSMFDLTLFEKCRYFGFRASNRDHVFSCCTLYTRKQSDLEFTREV